MFGDSRTCECRYCRILPKPVGDNRESRYWCELDDVIDPRFCPYPEKKETFKQMAVASKQRKILSDTHGVENGRRKENTERIDSEGESKESC